MQTTHTKDTGCDTSEIRAVIEAGVVVGVSMLNAEQITRMVREPMGDYSASGEINSAMNAALA